jgi:phenylpropionate dioxygenase-like ring-hydroxylating dioxygenase large terminal subunit
VAASKPETAKPWPMNAWYAAAWKYEIKRQLTPRTICGKDIVLYRKTDGQVAALEDACWHRLLPLSLGHLNGDQVVCGYHGLVFNSVGRCTYMPAQETINPSACVQSFPVVERYRLAWVWMGDPALADPDKIPDFHWNSDEPWVGEGGTFYGLKCDYRLVVDNLMDLTHETYVHAGSIGDDAITRNPFDVTHTDRKVTVSRWMENIEPPPFWARQLGKPESETSCHYFWNFVRSFRTDDQSLTKELNLAHVNDGKGVYDQDHAVLEAQQAAIDKNPRQPFYNLNIDAGALWARRMIDRMLAAEQGERPGIAAE